MTETFTPNTDELIGYIFDAVSLLDAPIVAPT